MLKFETRAVIAGRDTRDELAGVRARLGVGATPVAAPSGARRLVLAAVDEWATELLVATLRAEGELAVSRPDGGAPFDAWMRHTRPITFGTGSAFASRGPNMTGEVCRR